MLLYLVLLGCSNESGTMLLAKFPPLSFNGSLAREECFRVKVYSGGKSMSSPPGSFCYERTRSNAPRASGSNMQSEKQG